MNNKEIAERLGFTGGGKVEEMFNKFGFSSRNMEKVSKKNREKRLKTLLLEYYKIDVYELIDMIEEKKGSLE